MYVDDSRPNPTGREVAPAPANARAILRVGNEFFVRSIDAVVAAQDNDLIAALIFTALWIANVRHITYSPANLRFGGMDELPPDAMRRPVSVQALANTLQIPYETVRRYVQAMIKSGNCIRVGKRGLIIPAAVHNQPHRRRAFHDGLQSLLRFLGDLKRVGFDFAPYRRRLTNTVPLAASGEMPANGRALLRVSMELVMRGVDTMGRLHGGDFLSGMIYTTIWTANIRHITCSGDNLKYGGMNQLPPDELRRPVTVNAVAGALRLPYETTRRYVSALVRDGSAVRIDGEGVIIPKAQFVRPEYYEAARHSYGNIVQMMSDLHRAGFDFHSY
jgi:DNA-binding transcriptional regulator YhcF (GntR family)